MSKISLIVPVYKVELYLKKCIDSILDQTYENFEVILINDGSPDNCGNICEDYAKIDDRIIVIHKKNEGVSSARNVGLSIAKGEYIIFIDSDDFIHRDMLKTILKIAKLHNSDIVIFRYQKFLQDKLIEQPIPTYNVIRYGCEEAIKEMLLGNKFRGIVCNKLYKTSIVKKIIFPIDRKYGEDAKFTYEAIAKIKYLHYIDCELYYYRDNPNGALNKQVSEENLAIFETYDEIVDHVLKKFPNRKNELYNAYNIRIFEFINRMNDNKGLLKNVSKKTTTHLNGMLQSDMITIKNKILLILLAYSPLLFWKIYKK